MDNLSIGKFNKRWWQEIYKRVYGAVIFIEDCFAECLHWDGGLLNLMSAGAVGVKCLSSFECGNNDQKKAVFITKGTETNLITVKEIIGNSHFLNCILVVTADSDILSSETNGTTFMELEKLVTDWMGKKAAVIEIMFAPIFAINITNNVFTTPPFNNLYPKFDKSLNTTQPSSVDLHSLPIDDKNEVRRLACLLNSLLDSMDVKDDIYFMGDFSSILAGVLEHLPSAANRRKNASGQASIILIDRTVDLYSVTSHSSTSTLDKIMSVLPRFPGHSIDVAVDMSPLCEANVISMRDDIHLCPGCISHSNTDMCVETLSHLMNKSQVEVMFGLYDKLSKINVHTPSRLPPRVTALSLEKIITSFKGNYEIIENKCGILQQSLAIVQTLKSPEIQQIDLLISLEKQVLQNITTSRESTSILTQISNIIKSRRQRGLSLERLLAFLVSIYSLATGVITFSEAQEEKLHEALSIALFEDRNKIALNYEDNKSIQTPENCSGFARTLIDRLKEVSMTRETFVNYKSTIKTIDEVSPLEYRGVLQQLMDDLLNVEKPEMPDLKTRMDGLKHLLRSGLSIIMNTTTKKQHSPMKHPLDNPVVILFVLGGITAEECCKLHRSVLVSGSDIHFIIGSTSIVNQVESMRQALFLN